MAEIPITRSAMIRLLQQAIDAHPPYPGPGAGAGAGPGAGVSQPQLDDEQIALLVEGRLDELDETDRRRVLQLVAADPRVAQLVRELQALHLEQVTAGSRLLRPPAQVLRVVRAAWAAAACLLIMFGVWRLADPPAPITQRPDGTFQTYSTDKNGTPNYWDQLDQKRLAQQAQRDHIRDYALLASAGACLVLSIPLAYWLLCSGPIRKRE